MPEKVELKTQEYTAGQTEPGFNPGILKLDLFCKGMRVDESCDLINDARMVTRTRAGLGSGLEIVLPGKLYMNVPITESFALKSPYLLKKSDGAYYVWKNGKKICRVTLPGQPAWYTGKTSTGTVMSRVGVLQGTYLAVYPSRVCEYWTVSPKVNCRFCSTGLNVGVKEQDEKSVADVVEVALAAKKESGVTFVHFNTGFYEGPGKELDMIEPYVRAVKKETGLLIGIQCPPSTDLPKYDKLVKSGADHFSFCFEFFNPQTFKEYCPGKETTLGQQAFFAALEYTSKLLGKGKVSGEIVAGIEPIEDTLRAIDYITEIGAFPTICVFRPVEGSDMDAVASPTFVDMLPVFKHMYEACKKHNIPTGIAPNVKVSLVVLPYEGHYFKENKDVGDFMYSTRLSLLRLAFGAYFKTRMALRK